MELPQHLRRFYDFIPGCLGCAVQSTGHEDGADALTTPPRASIENTHNKQKWKRFFSGKMRRRIGLVFMMLVAAYLGGYAVLRYSETISLSFPSKTVGQLLGIEFQHATISQQVGSSHYPIAEIRGARVVLLDYSSNHRWGQVGRLVQFYEPLILIESLFWRRETHKVNARIGHADSARALGHRLAEDSGVHLAAVPRGVLGHYTWNQEDGITLQLSCSKFSATEVQDFVEGLAKNMDFKGGAVLEPTLVFGSRYVSQSGQSYYEKRCGARMEAWLFFVGEHTGSIRYQVSCPEIELTKGDIHL